MTDRRFPYARKNDVQRERARRLAFADLDRKTIPYDILSQYRVFLSQYDDPTRVHRTDSLAAALREWFLDHDAYLVECGDTVPRRDPSPSDADASGADDLLWVHHKTKPWSAPVVVLHLDLPTRHEWVDLQGTVANVSEVAERCRLNLAAIPRQTGGDSDVRTSVYTASETPANEEVYRITLELLSLDVWD